MNKDWLYEYILNNCIKIFNVYNSKKYWENIYYVCKLYNKLNPNVLEKVLLKLIETDDERIINISIMHLLLNKINKNKTLNLCNQLKKKYKTNDWDYSAIKFHLEENNAFIDEEQYNVGFSQNDLHDIYCILQKSNVLKHNEVYIRYPLEFRKILCQMIFVYDLNNYGMSMFFESRTKRIIDDFLKYNRYISNDLLDCKNIMNKTDCNYDDLVRNYIVTENVENYLLKDAKNLFDTIQTQN